MRLTRLLCLSSTLACAILHAEDILAVHCGALLDPENDTVSHDVVVLAEGGIVKQVLPADAQIPSAAKQIDLSKGFCLPGLIDVHDHLTGDPSDSGYQSLGVSVPRSTVKGVRNARITLQAGFTTVRNVGAAGFSDAALRDGINAGDIPGPRLFVSGPPLGITGGHCDNDLLRAGIQRDRVRRSRRPLASAQEGARSNQVRRRSN